MSFESRFDLVPLGSLAKFINGDRGENYPKPTDYVTEGIPFLSATDVGEGKIAWRETKKISPESYSKLRSGQVQRGDLLFCLRGSLGKLGYVENDLKGAIASSLVILRASNESIARYLRFVLGSADAQSAIKSLDNGSVQGNISAAALKSLMVPNPPEGIRTSITAVLESVDGRIDLNRRINQTLEAMAQAIFKSWFVDFDPVKAKIAAKAESRDPLRAAMGAISGKADAELDALPPEQREQLAATAALFPNAMEASNLGQIPKGWAINQISQFGDVVCGKTPSKTNPHFFGEGIPFIKIPDMHNNVYVVSPLEQLSASGAASQVKKTIPPGSICVSCIATVGKVVIAHEPSQTNQQINSIVPRHPQYTTYLYFQMRAKDKEFHDLASGGSATLNMNTSTFSKVSVLNPAFNVLEKFSVNVEPLFSEILVRQKQSALLSEARDTLLPKLLSGELSVADAMVEAVA